MCVFFKVATPGAAGRSALFSFTFFFLCFLDLHFFFFLSPIHFIQYSLYFEMRNNFGETDVPFLLLWVFFLLKKKEKRKKEQILWTAYSVPRSILKKPRKLQCSSSSKNIQLWMTVMISQELDMIYKLYFFSNSCEVFNQLLISQMFICLFILCLSAR